MDISELNCLYFNGCIIIIRVCKDEKLSFCQLTIFTSNINAKWNLILFTFTPLAIYV